MTADISGEQKKTLKVLQFTDTHFFRDSSHKLLGVDTAASFADVYRAASSSHASPDFFLLTGDLSQDETEESYRRLVHAMGGTKVPCYFLPGNHDRRKEMERGLLFPDSPFDSSRRIVKGKWQIIMLDSLVEGEVHGHLTERELDFLERSLEDNTSLFTLVCLHHHPVKMGAHWLDQIGVDNGDELMNLVSNYQKVKGLLWGHVHQEFNDMQNGKMLMATPSTCVQFKVRSKDFGVDALPPGYRWLELEPDGTIRSGVVRTDRVALGLELSSAGY